MHNGKVIANDADLYNCILFQTPVEVEYDNHIDARNQLIEKFNSDFVKIGGCYYARSECTIRVCKA